MTIWVQYLGTWILEWKILKQVDNMYLDNFMNKLNGNYIIIFPTFNLFSWCIKKIDEYETKGINIEPLWPTQILFTVYRTNKYVNNEPIVDSKKKESTVKPRLPTCEQDSSIVSRNDFYCMPSVRQSYWNSGFLKSTTSITMASWRTGTKKVIWNIH